MKPFKAAVITHDGLSTEIGIEKDVTQGDSVEGGGKSDLDYWNINKKPVQTVAYADDLALVAKKT